VFEMTRLRLRPQYARHLFVHRSNNHHFDSQSGSQVCTWIITLNEKMQTSNANHESDHSTSP
jgi:hypothetical protein